MCVVEVVIAMSGPVVFQMWMLLLLGALLRLGRAQVSTAKVMRGNIRREGEVSLLFLSWVAAFVACVFSVSSLLKRSLYH